MMARKMKSMVLDSWAALSFFDDESIGLKIADLISDAHDAGVQIFMSVVNLGEIWYIIARETTESDAEETIGKLRQLGITFVDIDWDLAQEAARIKIKNKISYAGCIASALAKRTKSDLVTGNPEFKNMDDRQNIHWI
jgi:uncharacterized protein